MTGFHTGELAVQRRAGVEQAAARLTGMLAPADLGGGLGKFLAGRTYAAMTARDAADRLWVSPLSGEPGFLTPLDAATLEIAAAPARGDALQGLDAGQPVGLLVIEYVARRRARLNGRLVTAEASRLVVEVDQAYGNCPQYIPPRPIRLAATSDQVTRPTLDGVDAQLVASVDTFVLGTTHPERGNDASHRGGPPGFLRVESPELLVWDDFPGNQMFNSFGNLTVDPTAALLLVDPVSGRPLQLSGLAELRWDVPASPTGRQVAFRVEAVSG